MKTDGRFIKVPYDLMGADGYVGKDNALIPLTITEKCLYCLMRSRFEYFVLEKKGAYYDTQENIGDSLKIDRRTVLQKVKLFMENGVIEGVKKKHSNFLNWNYTAVRDLRLWWKVDGKVVFKDPSQKDHPKEVESIVQKKHIPTVPVFDDESDLPF